MSVLKLKQNGKWVPISVGAQGPQGPQGIQGPQGETGPAGSDATVTAENIQSALGYTPANSADLADKLPKSPADWEPWTADEQTTARIRMGAVSATDVSTAITEALSAIGVAEEGSY